MIRTNRNAGSTNSSGGQSGPAASTAAPTSAAPAAASGTRRGGASMAASRSSNASGGSSGAAARKVSELNSQVKELKLNVEALERERDFYFGKLRDVEILLQTYGGGDKELVDKMFKILYATEEDFVTVDVRRPAKPPHSAHLFTTFLTGRRKRAVPRGGGCSSHSAGPGQPYWKQASGSPRGV